jgi:hypothetical protein
MVKLMEAIHIFCGILSVASISGQNEGLHRVKSSSGRTKGLAGSASHHQGRRLVIKDTSPVVSGIPVPGMAPYLIIRAV